MASVVGFHVMASPSEVLGLEIFRSTSPLRLTRRTCAASVPPGSQIQKESSLEFETTVIPCRIAASTSTLVKLASSGFKTINARPPGDSKTM